MEAMHKYDFFYQKRKIHALILNKIILCKMNQHSYDGKMLSVLACSEQMHT